MSSADTLSDRGPQERVEGELKVVNYGRESVAFGVLPGHHVDEAHSSKPQLSIYEQAIEEFRLEHEQRRQQLLSRYSSEGNTLEANSQLTSWLSFNMHELRELIDERRRGIIEDCASKTVAILEPGWKKLLGKANLAADKRRKSD